MLIATWTAERWLGAAEAVVTPPYEVTLISADTDRYSVCVCVCVCVCWLGAAEAVVTPPYEVTL